MNDVLANPIFLALIAYVVVMVGLLYLIHPVRMKLVEIVEEMLAEPRWNDEQREYLTNTADHCMSFATGLLLPFGILSIMLDDLLRRDTTSESMRELDADPRAAQIAWRFVLSVAAANPLAALLAFPLFVASLFLRVIMAGRPAKSAWENTLEESALRALGRTYAV